jgi:hypothetical protein
MNATGAIVRRDNVLRKKQAQIDRMTKLLLAANEALKGSPYDILQRDIERELTDARGA